MTLTKNIPKVTHLYTTLLQSGCGMCVACVCVMESLLPQFQAWLSALYIHIHLQMYKYTYKDSLGSCIHPAQLQTLIKSLILCFLVSASSAAAPSDRLAAVKIERIKGEVTVMSKAACFPLSQLRASTSVRCKIAARL